MSVTSRTTDRGREVERDVTSRRCGSPAGGRAPHGSAAGGLVHPPVIAPATSFSARDAGRGEPGARGVALEEVEAEEVAGGGADGALEGGRGRQPRPDRDVGVDGDVEPSNRVPLLAERPEHARDVRGPPARRAGCDRAQVDLDGLAQLHRVDPQQVVLPRGARGGGALRQGDGEHETTVVVGVLADEVDRPGADHTPAVAEPKTSRCVPWALGPPSSGLAVIARL